MLSTGMSQAATLSVALASISADVVSDSRSSMVMPAAVRCLSRQQRRLMAVIDSSLPPSWINAFSCSLHQMANWWLIQLFAILTPVAVSSLALAVSSLSSVNSLENVSTKK